MTSALEPWLRLRNAAAGSETPVFVDDAGEPLELDKLAEQLRAHLLEAGVTRTELHKASGNRRRLRGHDLRGTFVTLALANGRTETWVADRTGHTTSAMINRYRRQARQAGELSLGWLADMAQSLPEFADCPPGLPPGRSRQGSPTARPLRLPK